MIKFEVCRCKKPFNKWFREGELYVVHATKGSPGYSAYISPTQGFLIHPNGLVNTKVDYYKNYFEPIRTIYLQNYKEVKSLKKKTIQEILSYMEENGQSDNK